MSLSISGGYEQSAEDYEQQLSKASIEVDVASGARVALEAEMKILEEHLSDATVGVSVATAAEASARTEAEKSEAARQTLVVELGNAHKRIADLETSHKKVEAAARAEADEKEATRQKKEDELHAAHEQLAMTEQTLVSLRDTKTSADAKAAAALHARESQCVDLTNALGAEEDKLSAALNLIEDLTAAAVAGDTAIKECRKERDVAATVAFDGQQKLQKKLDSSQMELTQAS